MILYLFIKYQVQFLTIGYVISVISFAGFLAVINTRVFINPILYKNNGWYNDIVFGNNGTYSAINGYDNCTGFVSINGQILNSVATVDNSRIVTWLSIGNVTITAKSPINNISNSLNFNVYSHTDVFTSKSNISI